jgi:hypothetical protein
MFLTLLRIGHSEQGTFGVLRDRDIPFALTLEDPWHDNAPNESCIPEGHYTCIRIKSPRFGETFQILDVPGRTYILFHKGNTIADTKGCVLVGEEFSTAGDQPVLAGSGRGYGEFMDRLKGVVMFSLKIVNVEV